MFYCHKVCLPTSTAVQMDFKAPKRKKFAPFHSLPSFPVNSEKCYLGIFNGYNVIVSDNDGMADIYYMGNFGKGSLSKSAPNYHVEKDDLPKVILKQQWENRSKWQSGSKTSTRMSVQEKFQGFNKYIKEKADSSVENFLKSSFQSAGQESWKTWKGQKLGDNLKSKQLNNSADRAFAAKWAEDVCSGDENIDMVFSEAVKAILESQESKKVHQTFVLSQPEDIVVVSDTGVDVKESLSDVNAWIETNSHQIKETLNLNLQESFFLCFALGCLKINDTNGTELDVTDLWQRFRTAEKDFVEKYVIYQYYRSKGWTVRSGLKYGGDFLLYKTGPAFYHASYLIQIVNNRKMTWNEFVGINRLVETFNKDVVMCCVVIPDDVSEADMSTPTVLSRFSVQEVMSRRWLPSEERIIKDEPSLGNKLSNKPSDCIVNAAQLVESNRLLEGTTAEDTDDFLEKSTES